MVFLGQSLSQGLQNSVDMVLQTLLTAKPSQSSGLQDMAGTASPADISPPCSQSQPTMQLPAASSVCPNVNKCSKNYVFLIKILKEKGSF